MTIAWPRWWKKRARINPEWVRAVARWQALPPADHRVHAQKQRWVVVDVETTGLSMQYDQLVAIGAVAIRGGIIQLKDSFELVIRQGTPSSIANILIHRIAGSEQLAGREPPEALLAFLNFCGQDPLIGYHAAFDAGMVKKACRAHLGFTPDQSWLELADLANAYLDVDAQGNPARRRDLDDWLDGLGVEIHQRHNAAADALGTAQLMLALLPKLTPEAESVGAIFHLARQQHWLTQQQR